MGRALATKTQWWRRAFAARTIFFEEGPSYLLVIWLWKLELGTFANDFALKMGDV